jgi:hypothetical protein
VVIRAHRMVQALSAGAKAANFGAWRAAKGPTTKRVTRLAMPKPAARRKSSRPGAPVDREGALRSEGKGLIWTSKGGGRKSPERALTV